MSYYRCAFSCVMGSIRRGFLECGAGAQDVSAITLFKLACPSLLMLWSPSGRRSSGKIRCSSSSVWRRPSPSTSASVKEQLWEELFEDPSQWWDNRVAKRNPNAPDFKHKVTEKALWIDGQSTPPWVEARLKSMTQGKLQSDVGYYTTKFQDTAHEWTGCSFANTSQTWKYQNRLLKSNNGKTNSGRQRRQIVQGGNGNMDLQSTVTTSEAIAILKRRLEQGIATHSDVYVEVLKRCAHERNFEAAKHVHDFIFKSGMEHNTYVANSLLSVYMRCGRLEDARRVFDELVKKSVPSWNIMIVAYAQRNHAKDAMELFHKMRQEDVHPDKYTYLSILKACASPSALKWGREIHAHIRHAGFESDLRVSTTLVHMYAKSGSIDEARRIFDRMEKRDVITWNVMIGASCGEEAYRLFFQMNQEGIKPDAITYVRILSACASAGALEWVKEVHSHVLEAGLELDFRVGRALVQMYAKSGSIEYARLVFDRMEKRDVRIWNVMIGGLAQHGCGHEALAVFKRMISGGVKPDGTSFVAVLSACSHAGLVDEGRRLFLAMTPDHGVKPSVVHCTCMVDLLGRAGHLEEAKLFINNMPVEPNGATWGAVLGACNTYANVEFGELAAKELLKLEPKEASAYLFLSNIYAAAGKLEQASLVHTMLEERGICTEPGRSCIQIDNKIHDFVLGDGSHPEAKEIHTELSRLTEKIKAEGYIPDRRLVFHNIDEEDEDLALCSHSEKLAIAYGLLHTSPGNAIHVYKNLRVCSDCHTTTKFISKVTGRQIVVRDANRFHHFENGVCSCGDYW